MLSWSRALSRRRCGQDDQQDDEVPANIAVVMVPLTTTATSPFIQPKPTSDSTFPLARCGAIDSSCEFSDFATK